MKNHTHTLLNVKLKSTNMLPKENVQGLLCSTSAFNSRFPRLGNFLISEYLSSIYLWDVMLFPRNSSNYLVLFLFQLSAGGGMSIDVTPNSRPAGESTGGSYAGANIMANNGLSANQNQVSQNYVLMLRF